MSGRWFITPHAVARYRERVRPGASYQEALVDLTCESERAHYVGPAKEGGERWRGASPRRLRFVVKPSPLPGMLPALVTVETRCDADR